MKNELEMTISSRRILAEPAARDQITALSDFGDGLMRPDKCGEFEPIRIAFDPADISEPTRWPAEAQGRFFYRKGRPAHVAGEMWNGTLPPTSRFPSPLFSNYWTGQFDGKWTIRVGIEKVEDFVSEMFRATDSDFALLTTEFDKRARTNARRPL